MKAEDIRALSPEEQTQKVADLKEAYFKLRFQHGTGQLENTSALKRTRRDIARAKTILNARRS